jgi:signal transduction histidine kinase
MEKPTRYLRPYAALGIALTDRYRYNPYVKSTINIIALQVALSLLLVAAFSLALAYQQTHTITAVRTVAETYGLQLPDSTTLDPALAAVRSSTRHVALPGLVLLTGIFGWLAARFALRPTRDSLQFQKRFIGNMAHEVRTPLAIIKTNTEVALMNPRLDKDLRETLDTTLGELDRISETINNLLSFDTMVRPSRTSFGPINLSKLAESVAERHRALAKSRGIEFSYRAEDAFTIFGNATGIDQVLTNIVKNALNYTPQHGDGKVDMRLEDDGTYVKMVVADTGVGISKNDLAYIFQPFYRADMSRTRGVSGGTSGLGLAIVHEIVRHHNGKILVRSIVNRGTTFEIRLPKAKPSELATWHANAERDSA